MCIQSHLLATGVIMNIIAALRGEGRVNSWREAWLRLNRATDHGLQSYSVDGTKSGTQDYILQQLGACPLTRSLLWDEFGNPAL